MCCILIRAETFVTPQKTKKYEFIVKTCRAAFWAASKHSYSSIRHGAKINHWSFPEDCLCFLIGKPLFHIRQLVLQNLSCFNCFICSEMRRQQRNKAEVTVVQKLNQGSFPKTGRIPCQPAGWVFGRLFVTFSKK